jgi:hypothetical protein
LSVTGGVNITGGVVIAGGLTSLGQLFVVAGQTANFNGSIVVSGNNIGIPDYIYESSSGVTWPSASVPTHTLGDKWSNGSTEYTWIGNAWVEISNVVSSVPAGLIPDIIPDGMITPPKLSVGGPSWTSGGNLSVVGELSVGGGLRVTGGATFGGNLNVQENKVIKPNLQTYIEPSITGSISSNEITCDLSLSQIFNHTLSSSISKINVINVPTTPNTSIGFTLIVKQSSSGGLTFAFNGISGATALFPQGIVPLMTFTANKTDIVSYVTYDNGSNWFGFGGEQGY